MSVKNQSYSIPLLRKTSDLDALQLVTKKLRSLFKSLMLGSSFKSMIKVSIFTSVQLEVKSQEVKSRE